MLILPPLSQLLNYSSHSRSKTRTPSIAPIPMSPYANQWTASSYLTTASFMNPHSGGERSKVSFHHDRPGLHRPRSHQPSPGGSLLTSRRNPRALKKSGYIQCAGALFTDRSASGKIIGSVVIFQAENAEDLLRSKYFL